jgi:hypothetical protein
MNAQPPIRKPRRLTQVLIVAACLALPCRQPAAAETPQAASPLREALARGLVAEEVNRDLEAARREYEAVLASFTDQRAVAASALFRLAEIHRAQGRRDEAVAHYQRLLREFPDADREKDLARRQLEAWQVAPAADPAPAANDAEERTLKQLKQLRQSSPDLFRKAEHELRAAILNGHNRVLEYLIKEGLDPGRALVIASENGRLEAVKLVLAGPEKPDGKAAYDAISQAITLEFHEVLQALLAAGLDLEYQPEVSSVDPFENHGTILAHAITQKNALENVRALIAAGAKVNSASRVTGFTPLQIAIYKKHPSEEAVELIKFLLENGADVNVRTLRNSPDYDRMRGDLPPEASLSAMDLAMNANRPDLVALLIDRGADAKQEGLLAKACSLPDGIEIVRLLLDRGADPNLPADHPPIVRAFDNFDSKGTPNEQSARHRHQVALIRLLLERGADPNTTHDHFAHSDSDSGINLFAEPGVKRFPAGLFHQVIRLYQVHRWLNLDLVKILLDAGATPNHEFPEIFTFVATRGRSVRSSGGMSYTDGDAEPAEVALALLAHRPAEIDLEQLARARQWDAGVRRVFLDEVVHPELAQTSGITLSHFGSSGGGFRQLVEAGQPVPDTATLLLRNLEHLQFPKLTRVRRADDGTWQNTPIDWQGAGTFPDLQAGDIVEMDGDGEPPDQELLRWAMQKRLPAFPVTFEIGGKNREITIRPDLLAFDPAGNEAPLLHATALARLLGQGLIANGSPDGASHSSVTVLRKGWPDLKLSLAESNQQPFPLEAGDRLRVDWRDDILRLPRQDEVVLTIPGKPFHRSFPSDTPPTLVQAIIDAWSPWWEILANVSLPQDDEASLARRASRQSASDGENWVSAVPRGPDFSRIRIRRLAEDGSETVITVDLEKAIRDCTENTPVEQARLTDMPLQAGDIVEIPLRDPQAGVIWQGFPAETLRFFDKVLSARYVVIDPGQGVQQREFRYQPPRWIDGPHGLIALPPATGSPTARFTAIANGAVYEVREALRGGQELRLTDTGQWFVREGDQVTLSQGAPPPQPARQSREPRPRVVPPPYPH